MIGRTLGHYHIIAALGAGGMGEVYRATDSKLGRDVALKVLPPATAADAERMDRFRREARALAALDHPGIVTVYSVEEADGLHFLTMQLVEGRTLAESIPAEGLPAERLVDIAAAMAEALANAHAKGIVHRDLKPANVMVAADGRVKILDFGLAKLTAAGDAAEVDPEAPTRLQTQDGVVMGTLPYMSPEQVEGRPVDHRSDIFSLGAMLYEMTTGQRPFRGSSQAALMSAILRDDPAPSQREDVPGEVQRIIAECLRKDPQDRLQSAAEIPPLLAELRGTSLAGFPTPALTPAPTQPDLHTVGRRSELAELEAALAAAGEGRGSLVCVAGEPGMGKTTLVEDFLGRVKHEGRGLVASGRCSERLAGTEAYLPVLEALESLLRQGPPTSGQAPGAASVLKEVAPLWYAQVAMVSSVGGAAAPVLAAAQESSQERLKREFVAGLLEYSRTRPLVLFWDDLHWADVSTIDLLSYLAGKFAGLRVLVIVTYRPSDLQLAAHPFLQIRPDLQARGVCRELELAFLGEAEVRDYLALEFPEHRFPEGFARLIHAKTEGSPLFMADLLHDMRDRGVVAEVEGIWALARELPEIAQELPESVRGMVERKIGRLEEGDRTLLTAASVQGHVFDSAVAAVVLDLTPDEVEDRLDALEKVHAFVTLVDETELPDHTLSLRYRFVHALYQNELYAALRPTRRARLARKVGEVLEAFHGERTRGLAHELASLFEVGRDHQRAADYYLAAARQASRVYADREAAVLADKGIAALQHLDASPERARHELELQLALGVALRNSQGYGHPVTGRAYDRARDLCEEVGDDSRLSSVLFGLWEFHQNQGPLTAAADVARRMLELAERHDDAGQLVAAHCAMNDNLMCLGDPLAAIDHAQQAIALYDPATHGALAHEFGYDPAVSAHGIGAIALWMAGYPDRAVQEALAAADLADRLDHQLSRIFGSIFTGWLMHLVGKFNVAAPLLDDCIARADDIGVPAFRDVSRVLAGWTRIVQGDCEGGVPLVRLGVAGLAVLQFGWARSLNLGVLAEGLLGLGDHDAALDALAEAFAHAEQTGERFFVAELWRLKGEVLLKAGSGEGSEDSARCFAEALRVAREQQAKAWELRAACSLVRLEGDQRHATKSRAQLAAVLEGFTEGRESRDLRLARELLV